MSVTLRYCRFIAASLVLLSLGVSDVIAQSARQHAYTIEGLEAPVEILKDAWGVSHIYAETERDLFFAQGYNAARDRLFQLEMWRRQATGTMAEIMGERMLDHDIGARLMRFRGDLGQEMRHYHPRGDQIIPAFVAGINAYIDQVIADPALLPIEFRLMNLQPQHWTPEIVISRHQGLVGNVREELNLARAVAATDSDTVKDLIWFHPEEPALQFDDMIDTDLLSDDILRLYSAARSAVTFLPEDIDAAFRADASVSRDNLASQLNDQLAAAQTEVLGRNHDIGSNNWVVSGARSESGYPIMANDPHRVIGAPALRYFVHLHGPGWNIIGGGEPSLPGISIGHNGFGAWGLTVFQVDSEDLYVYETHPDNPNQYRYQGRWETMRTEQAEIMVRDQGTRTVELKFTRHGPVIHERPDRQAAFALRLAWLDIGAAPYLAGLRMSQAQSWEEFRDGASYSRIPGENFVWADRDGNIGYQAVGVAPLRPNWDGLLPVPGDGRYEWDGYLPILALPNATNPEQGFWNTSNENMVPDGYQFRNAVGWTWTDPYRGNRVREVLASGQRFNLQDMAQLQNDSLSIPARTLVPLLNGLEHDNNAVELARQQLLNWDFRMAIDSVAAGIYMAWERELRSRVSAMYVPEAAQDFIGLLQMKPTVDRLLSPDGRFGMHSTEGRDRLMMDALAAAVNNLRERFGSDMNRWQYGQEGYKHALLRHPMSAAVSDELRASFEVGPAPRHGYSYTVSNTGYGDNQTSGGSFRMIVDTEDFDRALASNTPGQSGDPDSPFYDNLFEDWIDNRYFPLFYSRDKVESVTAERLNLTPAD
ncbi:penicillin acylase family protein [Pseudohongiella spirulinae]|uniref:Acyl-homoserine lactone acylase QuiP n=1 Tax=Pseudohongiella spirulinae TaxID=1249552 RepID=A0A0S2KCF7_9GAMM|nr:penicillin acylase family protein [Pseudohongiella spirulinae]ALO45795.1 Acyl-homoserine-lactone acylase [Pseudohongiella spirulinae]